MTTYADQTVMVDRPRYEKLQQDLHPRLVSLEERERIADLSRAGCSIRQIAQDLGRAPSTVSRELRRNRSQHGPYHPYAAHRKAAKRRPRPKSRKLVACGPLRAYVQEKLSEFWSPEQISRTLRVDYPTDLGMRVATETIYQTLYVQGRGQLRREIAAALRNGKARRTPRRQTQKRQQRFTDPMVMISERPPEVADRAVPGHWEGDLIIGREGGSQIGTLVERSTRYVMLVHLPGSRDAATTREALTKTMSHLPAHLRRSLTWDQGGEMAEHKRFSIATDIPVFSCDPASPWQRGSNENTNRLLRQYFPKGTDLSRHSPEELARVAQQLNTRPRKTLGWDTPAQRLNKLLQSTL
ncbi:IS30 family transposase [Leucobacter insecticola]|uniref:IS30 family transposase n=2 Tax=Leucobacter insecticola TaxID=2714934 RepID=A0A6G8FLC9_9MICO|nr:IS30 family transposase [Leucobacter insecticola]QIM17290.1 IS30 family transposase [Leucobacter insecticola]